MERTTFSRTLLFFSSSFGICVLPCFVFSPLPANRIFDATAASLLSFAFCPWAAYAPVLLNYFVFSVLTRYGGDDASYTGMDDLNSLEVYKEYDDFPGFVVPAGSLGFSVICFTLCACVAIGILAWRRQVRERFCPTWLVTFEDRNKCLSSFCCCCCCRSFLLVCSSPRQAGEKHLQKLLHSCDYTIDYRGSIFTLLFGPDCCCPSFFLDLRVRARRPRGPCECIGGCDGWLVVLVRAFVSPASQGRD